MKWAVALGLLAVAAPVDAAAVADKATKATESTLKALAILDRTKKVTTTYSVYLWNRITQPGAEPVEEWSAEFHSGDLHRVETPRDRIVADCRAGTGILFSVPNDAFARGPHVANAACGINMNSTILKVEWVGTVKTRFGEAQRIRVVDRDFVRQYDVSREGVLLGSTYTENRPDGRMVIQTEAVGYEAALRDAATFDPASLDKSFVPEDYRRAPDQRSR
jgi:hypothetical protein